MGSVTGSNYSWEFVFVEDRVVCFDFTLHLQVPHRRPVSIGQGVQIEALV